MSKCRHDNLKLIYSPEQVGTGSRSQCIDCKALFSRATLRTVDGNTSDGYHTFNELYEFRMLYNAAFFNTLWDWQEAEGDQGYKLCKSKRHSDGELCFGGGWFVVVAQLPSGQITNHYEIKDWDLFQIDEVKKAPKWDGHTPQDVAERLRAYLLRRNQRQ